MILVLVPKGNTDTWGIVLLEKLWNLVEAIINTCLGASIRFHYVLHCFCMGRGTWTAIMELKLAQDMDNVN